MNALLQAPLPLRLACLFLLGGCVGSLLNLVIYRLCWFRRAYSPWTPGLPPKLQANWSDRLPIVGWLYWRRRQDKFGRGFWIRPLFVEVLTASLFAGLYWWEVEQFQLLGLGGQVFRLPADVWPCPGGPLINLHLTLQSHLILVSLMIAASFIDLDDQIIPDSITVPGTLAGLFLAAAVPWSLLPNGWLMIAGARQAPIIDFLKLSSPHAWPASLAGWPETFSLAIGLACFWGWCLALMPRRWRLTRRGWKVAWKIFIARLVGDLWTWLVVSMGVVGSLAIGLVWWRGEPSWVGLLTALVGMAISGGLVWLVRIFGGVALGKEAMGFGDVTLMAMIGAFLGWQASLIIFFVAAFIGLAVGVVYWLVRRVPKIPYGPFLCLGALVVMVRWPFFWDRFAPMFEVMFELGWLVPLVVVACMLLMGILLFVLRGLRKLFGLADA